MRYRIVEDGYKYSLNINFLCVMIYLITIVLSVRKVVNYRIFISYVLRTN